MLRDFHDLWLLVNESMMSLIVLEQAARALRDQGLLDTPKHMQDRNELWLKTWINQAAPTGGAHCAYLIGSAKPAAASLLFHILEHFPSALNRRDSQPLPPRRIWGN
jgi:hypothetical protein